MDVKQRSWENLGISNDFLFGKVMQNLKVFLDYVAGKSSNDTFIQELDEAVMKAKQNREWRHEYMTLLMRDQMNVEKGIEIGIEQGIEGTVAILKNLDIPPQTILIKIQEQYNLSPEAAEKYL